MAISNVAVKKTAKTALQGRWVECIAVALLFLFSSFVGYLAAGLLSGVFPFTGTYVVLRILFGLLLDIPLLFGVLRFYWRVLWGAEDRFTICFFYFADKKQYVRALKTVLLILGRVALLGIVLFAPAILIDLFSGESIYKLLHIARPEWLGNLWLLSRVLKVFAATVLFLSSLRYYMAPFLLLVNEELEPLEILHVSQTASKQTVIEFVWFTVSFLGWILASFFVVPLLYTLPYMGAAYLVHCRFVTAQYNRKLQQQKKSDPTVFTAE